MTSERMLDICLPNGGFLLGFIECYFDESGTHSGAPAMAVAGFVFDKDAAKILNIMWREVLADHKLPYFHMTDCATRNGIFKDFDSAECDLVARKLIQIIKKTATMSLSCAVNEDDYNEVFRDSPFYGSAYTFCIQRLLAEFQIGIPFSEAVTECAFFFEAGHKSQGESNNLINKIFADKEFVDEFKYTSHAFLLKTNSPEIQAADILAWLTYKDLKNQLEGMPRKRRKDYESLQEIPNYTLLATKQNLLNIRAEYIAQGLDKYHQNGK